MEVRLFAGRRMPGRVAGGDDRIQDAAGALGQGVNPSLQENTPQGALERRLPKGENRSVVSPDGQLQLSANDRALGFAVAGHDYSLLSGFAKRTVSEELAAIAALPATVDGSGNRADGHEYACRARSGGWQADRLRPHSKVPRRIEEGQG